MRSAENTEWPGYSINLFLSALMAQAYSKKAMLGFIGLKLWKSSSGNIKHNFYTWIDEHKVQTITPLRIFELFWSRLCASYWKNDAKLDRNQSGPHQLYFFFLARQCMQICWYVTWTWWHLAAFCLLCVSTGRTTRCGLAEAFPWPGTTPTWSRAGTPGVPGLVHRADKVCAHERAILTYAADREALFENVHKYKISWAKNYSHQVLQSTDISSLGRNSSVPLPDGIPQRQSSTGTHSPSCSSCPSGHRQPENVK